MCLMWKVERSMSLISGMHDNGYTVHSQWVIELHISIETSCYIYQNTPLAYTEIMAVVAK